MKKILPISLAAMILLASCGKTEKKVQTKDTNQPVTIFAMHLGKALDPNLPVFKEAAQKTGVTLKNVASQNQTNEIQAYNLMLTQTPLPDIIAAGIPSNLEDLGIDGGLISLEKLIKEDAPHIQKFFDENPDYRKDATAVNGHIYMIPNFYDYHNLNISLASFIRKDWLKKLGLPVPKTLDQLHNTLIAFRDKDPNGNGKKDEIPLFLRGDQTRKILLSLADIFKASPVWELDNGKVVYGPSTEAYKNAMIQAAKWYKEGLIDKEIFTRGIKARDFMLGNNIGGFTLDWVASTSSYNSKLKDKIPGFDFGIMLPVEYNGIKTTNLTRPHYEGAWGISKDAKDPVRIIKYMDFWYTPEGRRLWNFGIEGKDYMMVDGKPVFTDAVLKSDKNPLQVLRADGAQFRLGMWQDYNYELGWATPEAKKNFNIYKEASIVKDQLPDLKYTKEDSSKFTSIDLALRNYVEEQSQEWILGTEDVNKTWDSYIEKLNQLGLQKATEIQNKAWEQFNK